MRVNHIAIWEDTVEKCNNGSVSKIGVLPSIKFNSVNVQMRKLYPDTQTYVLNMDTADAAIDVISKGYHPLLLNMSDNKKAGGNVRSGSPAQEENLFRRSNYFKTLTQDFYPLENTDAIYSPQVCFFKDNESCAYNDLAKYVFIDCIACPAINCPDVDRSDENGNDKFKLESDRSLMKEKARMIFQVAYMYGHDILILSAHGCGAWSGPAHDIAQIYRELVDEYKGCFRAIIFAILADGPVTKSTKNFNTFKQFFG